MTVDVGPAHDEGSDSPALEVAELRVVLGEQPALRGLDLTVARGARLALVGPNGAGKSTLLRVVAGLIRPSGGDVRIAGRSLRADPWHARRSVGLVGHQSMMHPELTARENLRVFAQLYALDRCDERVEAGLRQVGLSEQGDARVATLSRGMIQRLALARALLHEPSLLLLDEAEAGLDVRAHDRLVSALCEREAGRTAILASHDLGFVREVANEVVFLRLGRVVGRVRTAGLTDAELREVYSDAMAPRTTGQAVLRIGAPG
jgi:heme ABC exporter ATP-binding subunit CcmA